MNARFAYAAALQRIGALLIAAAVLFGAGGALAQEACAALAASLSSLDRQIGSSSNAAQQAQAALRSAQAQAAQMSCERRIFASRECRAVLNEVDRLQSLVAQYGPTVGTDQLRAQRNSIQARMVAANCPLSTAGGPGIRYRTICVRSCDGFYFPISYSATRDQIPTDALSCSLRCPGQDVRLYYLRSSEEDIATAQSLSGTTYAVLPTAYAYRSGYEPDCGCGPAVRPDSVLADVLGTERAAEFMASIGFGAPEPAPYTPLSPETLASLSSVPIMTVVSIPAGPPYPAARPEPSEDPETIANRAGGLVPGAMMAARLADAERRDDLLFSVDGVRIVGPAYSFYAREIPPPDTVASLP